MTASDLDPPRAVSRLLLPALGLGLATWAYASETQDQHWPAWRRAVPVSAEVIDPTHEGDLVMATGVLTTQDALDDALLLRAAPTVVLMRHVAEGERSTGKGGNSWWGWGSREASRGITAFERRAARAQLGAFAIDPATLEVFHVLHRLDPGPRLRGDVRSTELPALRYVPTMRALTTAADGQPGEGEVMITFSFVPSGLGVTVLGVQRGAALVAPTDAEVGVDGFGRLWATTGDHDAAIAQLRGAQPVRWSIPIAGAAVVLAVFAFLLPLRTLAKLTLALAVTFGLAAPLLLAKLGWRSPAGRAALIAGGVAAGVLALAHALATAVPASWPWAALAFVAPIAAAAAAWRFDRGWLREPSESPVYHRG